jgi:signal transduction histidine kinase
VQAKTHRSINELLAAYRGFALAVAAMQIGIISPEAGTRTLTYVIIGVLAAYSAVWVFMPKYRAFRESYFGLAVDVALSTAPLLLVGGLSSPFLLYSLSPIIHAALIFPRMVALGCALFSSAVLVGSLLSTSSSQANFGFVGLYVIACFLVGIMPYTANLDTHRRMEQDVALKERRKLARELHDTVAQTLAYLNVKASLVSATLAKGNLKRSLSELEQMKESLDSTYEEVRHTIETLGRSSSNRIDFIPALSHRIEEFSRKSGIAGHLTVSENGFKLSAQAADELLHIVGEAMVNARNHALAGSVEVGVSNSGEQVSVTVRDNGCGFDLSKYSQSERAREHHGLTIMKERAESLGGALAIDSRPGRGTEVKVSVPLE